MWMHQKTNSFWKPNKTHKKNALIKKKRKKTKSKEHVENDFSDVEKIALADNIEMFKRMR